MIYDVVRNSRNCDSREAGNCDLGTSRRVVRLIYEKSRLDSLVLRAQNYLESKKNPVCNLERKSPAKQTAVCARLRGAHNK